MQLNLSSGSQPALGLSVAVPLSNLKKAFFQFAGSSGAVAMGDAHIWSILGESPCRELISADCKQQHVLDSAVISQNHRIAWAGRDLNDHLVTTPLPWDQQFLVDIDPAASPDVKTEDDREAVALPDREMFIWTHHSLDPLFCKTSVFMKGLSAPEVPVPQMNLVMSLSLNLPQTIPSFWPDF